MDVIGNVTGFETDLDWGGKPAFSVVDYDSWIACLWQVNSDLN